MSEGRAYTEAEVVAARQEAFVSGARMYWTAYDASDTGFPLGDMTEAAKIRYPDPKKPRVVTTSDGTKYRVTEGVLEADGGDGWFTSGFDSSKEVIRIIADLLANPFEAPSK